MEKTMILRGVPGQVHKESKMAAADLDITLQEFCIRALRLACMQKEAIEKINDKE